jgi:hypothetical protein
MLDRYQRSIGINARGVIQIGIPSSKYKNTFSNGSSEFGL